MVTIKSYTDLEQSKKLEEILPLESADMWWSRCTITDFGDGVLKVSYAVEPCNISQFRNTKEDIPCWSIAALLNVLPKGEYKEVDLYFGSYQGDKYIDEWFCSYEQHNHPFSIETCHASNPVDTCYEMIVKLHERSLL